MITVIVEGPGDQRSLPVLVQREKRASLHCVNMGGKSNIVRMRQGFEGTIRRQHALGKRAFMVLVDGDVTFEPYKSIEEEQVGMRQRAETLEHELGVPVRVCWAVIEVESWLIGGIQPRAAFCGLERVGQVPNNTETAPADPKAWLEDHLEDSYTPRTQECLARNIDLEEATRRNQSLQTFFENVS